ncbi:MAG TPA: ATP-dependent RecD-like DNA helicase [Candidatus Hydrogenedens sp.]|nr:ATP-dependent RecD-like DNA helicase [Candidatus Hydrogenedens sp.]
MDPYLSEIPFTPKEFGQEEIEGVIEQIIYEHAGSGFFVARLRRKDTNHLITIVGKSLPVSQGTTVCVSGYWINHPRFGPQFQTQKMELVQPSSTEAVAQFLASGAIPGIGTKYAERIIKTFGSDVLHVLNHEPERLTLVPRLGKKRAEKIYQVWKEKQEFLEVLLCLQEYHIPIGLATKLYKYYGNQVLTFLREDPFQIASEVQGIGFRTADRIAKQLGIAPDHPSRIEAGIRYTLQEAESDGHVFLREDEVVKSASELLQLEVSQIINVLHDMQASNKVYIEEQSVYLPFHYFVEEECVKHLKRIFNTPSGLPKHLPLSEFLSSQHSGLPMLNEEQQEAIRQIFKSKITIITGGPGTGKTTLIKSLVYFLKDYPVQIVLTAPTGRAARQMEAITGHPACTIHRLLEFNPKDGEPNRNGKNPIFCNLLIVDESSMVDHVLFLHLLRAVPSTTHIVFVGDVDQLPSVGPGNVLFDLIASEVFNVIRLKTIFRQSAQSGIILNAHRVNQGKFPEFNQTDFFFIRRGESPDALQTLLHIVQERIPKKFGYDPIRDIQVLAPLRRGDAGVHHLNYRLQEALNPKGKPIPHSSFRIGDKVMQIKNNYEKEVFNGDIGIITDANPEQGYITIVFEPSHPVIYTFEQLDQISLAYSATVHKAQGSEYPVVVLLMLAQHYLLLQRNVLYTAITRAKKLVTIIGSPNAIQKALHSTHSVRRNTRLTERIKTSFKYDYIE